MAKIHTHYDNLKVSRHAPQEVIRASYKALSQKYHPDKNPGDEKSARIMAVVNTAYNVLSDPVRRKEHDEWIASEEWEVAWLESSSAKEGQPRKHGEHGEAQPNPKPRRRRLWRDPRWWLGLSGCFVAGAVAAVLTIEQQPDIIPSALAWSGIARAESIAIGRPEAPEAGAGSSAGSTDPGNDSWARRIMPDGAKGPPPAVRALAVAQLAVPARAPDCSTDLQTLAAPSGDPWPLESSYLPGYPVGNEGGEMQVAIDNSANAAPVFVKLYDLERRANVRHAFVQQRSSFTFDKLAAGRYEVRYQNIVDGASQSECDGSQSPLRQAAADQ
ncbi:J domain-containing protein [Telluria beijingensis]|uniref:J domain-containing protein n=1 Tax=Telluria beijingensis TaxID=3068633 RepID=UPI002795AF80|nr:J domain-containing protein [Massilia sp. REN29]